MVRGSLVALLWLVVSPITREDFAVKPVLLLEDEQLLNEQELAIGAGMYDILSAMLIFRQVLLFELFSILIIQYFFIYSK